MICPVVAQSENPPNLTKTSYSNEYWDFHWWGLWGEELWYCEELYDVVLNNTSEFNKGGSNSAGTIMALLPSLMAFAPIITANIGFLCHLSTTQGFIAAGFTFGLPVYQLNIWKQVSIRAKDLLADSQLCHENIATASRPFSEVVDTLLAPIKRTALLSKRPRRIWVQLLRFLFGAVQAILVWCLLIVVPTIDSIYLIWLCPNWGKIVFSLWLGATFTILGWLRARFEKDAFAGDEVIYINKVNPTQSTGTYWRRLLDHHPMIVILRPSNDSSEREPCWTNRLLTRYFIGIFQLFWLCFFSFLFSSTIGGTLFWTLIMVVVFIAVIGLSRGLSILACWLALKHLDLRVIEYDNLEEKKMVQRLLGGVTDILLDIRWVRFKKSQWQESVEMYRRGHQLSRPDDPEQCALHTDTQGRDVQMDLCMRVVGVALTAGGVLFTPRLRPPWAVNNLGPILNPTVVICVRAIIFATTFSCLHLGRTRRLLICSCR